MELRAIIEGLKALKERCDVTIVTDSEIAISWCRQKKRSKKFPHEMAVELAAALAGHKLTFQWVKGHAGHPDNERCDRLAREQRTSPFSA
jgi:ribonuclease HI